MDASIQRSFYRRLPAAMIFSALVLISVVVFLERMVLLDDLRDKGAAITRILSSVILDATLKHDYATMERYVAEVSRGRHIVSVRVTRADGETLAASGAGSRDRTSLFPVSTPVAIGDDRFATVEIIFSTSRVERLTRLTLLYGALLVVFFHFIATLIVRYLLTSTVVRPLNSLEQAISHMSDGNYHERISISGPQEFARIGSSFNTMSERIQHTFRDLEQSRRSLEAEQQKLAAIVSSVADGLFVTDSAGVIRSFNRAATNITGYATEEALYKTCTELFRSPLCQDACALFQDAEVVSNLETSLFTKTGEHRVVSVSSAKLRGPDGEITGGVQTFRDITDDKRRQEVFCQTEKLAAVGELAAGVAHEINTPLGNILGYARLIDTGTVPEEVGRKVEIIIEQTRKCSAIVQGLLDYSRMSPSSISRVDLGAIARQVAGLLSVRAEKQRVSLDVATDPDTPWVQGDPRKLEQVAFNLLNNSLQAVAEGGAIQIKTAGTPDGRAAFLEMSDNGPGVPPELRCRIFDPFFTTKPVGQGTGLGLSICAGIITELDGIIAIEDRPGGGAVFRVTLPVTADQSDAAEKNGVTP